MLLSRSTRKIGEDTVMQPPSRLHWSKKLLAAACLLPCSVAQGEPQIDADEARPRVMWQDADSVRGQVAFVYGEVINVGASRNITFVNFDKARPPEFTVVIFKDHWDKFPQPIKDMYEGKLLQVRGRVSAFRDKPQIAVTSPDQIEIIESLPDLSPPAEPAAIQTGDELVVASFNVLNLFDEVDDAYRGDEGTGAKPRSQLEALAGEIRALDADVIALQEVENRGYLERFVQVFLSDMGYEHVVHFEGNDGRGIDVCLLSRVPVGEVRSHRHLKFADADGRERRFNRDLLAVEIEPPGAEPFEVWVVHLKSNSGGREFAEPIRLAEARKVRELLDEALTDNPGARIIVTGDFNDTWETPTLQTIVGSGPTKLWSAASDAGGAEPITYNQGRYQTMIDFMLCSPAMAERYVEGSFEVRNGSPESTGSDHNPVIARFRVR